MSQTEFDQQSEKTESKHDTDSHRLRCPSCRTPMEWRDYLFICDSCGVQIETYLSTDDVCAIFDLPRSTLYTYTSEGRIPLYKIGNHLRFKLSELEAWAVKN